MVGPVEGPHSVSRIHLETPRKAPKKAHFEVKQTVAYPSMRCHDS